MTADDVVGRREPPCWDLELLRGDTRGLEEIHATIRVLQLALVRSLGIDFTTLDAGAAPEVPGDLAR